MEVVCIAGQARAGKDSFANSLKQKLTIQGKRVLIYHHADYLKYLCKQYFDWDGNKDEKGRTILQHIGTDIVRKKKPDFWVNTALEFFNIFNSYYDYVLISDARFSDEIDSYKNIYKTHSVKIIRINADRTEFNNGLTPEQKNHISETALNNYKFDATYSITTGLDNIDAAVEDFVEVFLNGT